MSLMSISSTSFAGTDRLEMHTTLFNRISEPESFSDSLCPMHCTHTTISVDGKASNLSLSDKFETGKHQSIQLSFLTCSFATTPRNSDIPERNFDLLPTSVNEHKFITQSHPIRQHSGNWKCYNYVSCYSKQFIELQSQPNQVSREKFNGISLFASCATSIDGVLNHFDPTEQSAEEHGGLVYGTYSRTLATHDPGARKGGFALVNEVNFQFMLSIHSTNSGGSGFDLGNIHAGNHSNTAVSSGGHIRDVAEINGYQLTDFIKLITDMRAENGVEQNRLSMTMDLLRANLSSIESAHGRIMDTDKSVESRRFARQNVLVQASSSMTAQANQLKNVAVQLVG